MFFEACSAFTRVTTCVLAESPKMTLLHQSISAKVVTSPSPLRLLPTGATSCRTGLTPAKDLRLCTAYKILDTNFHATLLKGHLSGIPVLRQLSCSLTGSHPPLLHHVDCNTASRDHRSTPTQPVAGRLHVAARMDLRGERQTTRVPTVTYLSLPQTTYHSSAVL